MPRYVYACRECQVTYQRTHSIKEKLTDCEECGAEDTLKRVPSILRVLNGEDAGQLVKGHIEETKKDLQEDKEELRKAEYE